MVTVSCEGTKKDERLFFFLFYLLRGHWHWHWHSSGHFFGLIFHFELTGVGGEGMYIG